LKLTSVVTILHQFHPVMVNYFPGCGKQHREKRSSASIVVVGPLGRNGFHCNHV